MAKFCFVSCSYKLHQRVKCKMNYCFATVLIVVVVLFIQTIIYVLSSCCESDFNIYSIITTLQVRPLLLVFVQYSIFWVKPWINHFSILQYYHDTTIVYIVIACFYSIQYLEWSRKSIRFWSTVLPRHYNHVHCHLLLYSIQYLKWMVDLSLVMLLRTVRCCKE